MSHDKLKYISVNTKEEKITLTTRDLMANASGWEHWIYRPTLPVFDVKLAELTKDILRGCLIPISSCNHQKLFKMLNMALCSLSKRMFGENALYTAANEKEFVYFVTKAITIPYFYGQDINMEKITSFIKDTLYPQFANSFAETDAAHYQKAV